MGFMDGLADLFPHTVTIAAYSSQNEAGEATHGTEAQYRARVERGTVLARNASGDRSLVPGFKVFLDQAVAVDVRDALTLEDQAFWQRNEDGVFEAPTLTIVGVTPIYDEREWVCTVVECG